MKPISFVLLSITACACGAEISSAPPMDAGSVDPPDAAPLDVGSTPDAEVIVDAGDLRPITVVFEARGSMPPSDPTVRWGAPMAFVPSERKFVLFGGSQYPSTG